MTLGDTDTCTPSHAYRDSSGPSYFYRAEVERNHSHRKTGLTGSRRENLIRIYLKQNKSFLSYLKSAVPPGFPPSSVGPYLINNVFRLTVCHFPFKVSIGLEK
jgi:hypothetical protein